MEKELDLQELKQKKQAELLEFIQENGAELKLDQESIQKGLKALDDDRRYEVSGKFLNEVLAYLSRVTVIKAQLLQISSAFDVNTTALGLGVDSMSLEVMKEIREVQLQNLLD